MLQSHIIYLRNLNVFFLRIVKCLASLLEMWLKVVSFIICKCVLIWKHHWVFFMKLLYLDTIFALQNLIENFGCKFCIDLSYLSYSSMGEWVYIYAIYICIYIYFACIVTFMTIPFSFHLWTPFHLCCGNEFDFMIFFSKLWHL